MHKQIVEVSSLLATRRVPGREADEWTALTTYIWNQDHREWIWAEIELYRMVGQSSTFLLDGVVLARDDTKSKEVNDSRLRCLYDMQAGVQAWCYLAVENALGRFLMHDDVHAVRSEGGSGAELLRAYIRTQEVQDWNEDGLFYLWKRMYEAAEDFRRLKRERTSLGTLVLRSPYSWN